MALKLHPKNPRRGDVAAIALSLQRNGLYTPLTWNRRTGHILRGNHTLRAAIELGWTEIDVYPVDVDEQAELRILAADNRTSDLATYDTAELADLLRELDDLAGTGYDERDFDALLDELDAKLPLEDDEAPALPAEPITEPGELIVLGEHRLVCGDSRDPAIWERLEGAKAELLWTDPPYGVDYEGRTKKRLRIASDSAEGLGPLLQEAFANANQALLPGAAVYLSHPGGGPLPLFLEAFIAQGWRLRQSLIWVKDTLVLGHADYQYRHEGILYGFTEGGGRRGRGGTGWYGGNDQSSVFELPRPRSSAQHPTMKPPELIAIALRNSSRRGALVLDPFAGSGSTLIACHRLGRRARLIEIAPAYCDVIVNRFEQLSGERVIRSGAS